MTKYQSRCKKKALNNQLYQLTPLTKKCRSESPRSVETSSAAKKVQVKRACITACQNVHARGVGALRQRQTVLEKESMKMGVLASQYDTTAISTMYRILFRCNKHLLGYTTIRTEKKFVYLKKKSAALPLFFLCS